MLKALGLRSSSSNDINQSEKVDRVIKQALNYENTLKAMDYVLDDRCSEGIAMLKDKDDAISQLGLGLIQFIEATLGFEYPTMKLANETLVHSESLSWKEKVYAEKNKIKTSSIYPPGTEWILTYAEANLLSALLMLFSESMVESAKALLKLRRAYHALDEISKSMEKNNANSINLEKLDISSNDVTSSSSTSLVSSVKFIDLPMIENEQQLKDNEVINKLEKLYKIRKARIDGDHIGNPPVTQALRQNLGFKEQEDGEKTNQELEANHGNSDVPTVDEFIHSGVNLCFGILQVVLSLIPPAIGKVLSVVGFKGSREVGLKMVWNAAKERNIHGGLGLLALLVFYDGPFQFTDTDFDTIPISELKKIDKVAAKASDLKAIKTSTSSKSINNQKKTILERNSFINDDEPTLLHPGEKLVQTLLHSRALFPNGNLWLLQESRMLASRGRLTEAISLMDSSKASEMKQVDALLGFDRALILVFLSRFDRAGDEFLHLCKINSYSHCLYTFFAGACYLECYRMCLTGLKPDDGESDVDFTKKDYYYKRAEECLNHSVELIGKKKFMSKIPPFEKFINRKMKHIKKIKSSTGLKFIESIGTSLIFELAYFWNGYNRMSESNLKFAIKMLGLTANKVIDPELDLTDPNTEKSYTLIPETNEESMIRHTLQALSLRRLGDLTKGESVLDKYVIRHITETGSANVDDKLLKLTENPWLYPTALYEKALFVWKRKYVSNLEFDDGLHETLAWLKKSQSYGGDDYELSTRVGMKTNAAFDRLQDML